LCKSGAGKIVQPNVVGATQLVAMNFFHAAVANQNNLTFD
jgi:hypothetical protein